MAESRAQTHSVFLNVVQDLAAAALAQSEADRTGRPRPWDLPRGLSDTLDIAGMTTPFNREEIDAAYEGLLADGQASGTMGDVVATKVQGDYVACVERAFRARHATPVRLAAMASGRRAGHGHPRGVFLGGVVQFVQDAIKAGRS